ncbi:DUF952 domain-containing protein [Spirosoma taeanense]|uniref:DUF952 domain-containing protein n=1 Tax=Spirosoma taeanense TaxID=2735870 RepID=A0A6M5YD59_9BACT|nr:DUF952 domain-containing protein [Spirosoma taeanense]QJW91929.1 DUF952 domain-containing protein [Spirosoma taeanense]
MNSLYHVVAASEWAKAESLPTYEAGSLQTEGFIHLSERHQVAGVLERYYQHVPDLLLLHIDGDRLSARLVYEVSTNNERFPHLYGPLNTNAVVAVERLP